MDASVLEIVMFVLLVFNAACAILFRIDGQTNAANFNLGVCILMAVLIQ